MAKTKAKALAASAGSGQVRKSALKKPKAEAAATQKTKTGKESKAQAKTKEIQEEVMRRAELANAGKTGKTPGKKQEKKLSAEKIKGKESKTKDEKKTKENPKKEGKTDEKKDDEKKDDKKKGETKKDEKKKGETKKDEKKKDEKKEDDRKKDDRKKDDKKKDDKKKDERKKDETKKNEAKKDDKEQALRMKKLQEELTKLSTPPVTPPTRRHRMKSPTEASTCSGIKTDATAYGVDAKKKKAEEHFASLRLALPDAVKEAEDAAELDAAGPTGRDILDFYQKMREDDLPKKLAEKEKREAEEKEKGEKEAEDDGDSEKEADASESSESEDEDMENAENEEDDKEDDQKVEVDKDEGSEKEMDEQEDVKEKEDDSDSSSESAEDEVASEPDSLLKELMEDAEDEASEEEEQEVDEEVQPIDDEPKKKESGEEPKETPLIKAVGKTVRNSTTNKKEWDKMDKQIKSGAFPVSLQPMLKKKQKVDLFNLWLDFGQSWDKVVAEVSRVSSNKNLSRRQWVAVQAKTLKAQFDDEDKFNKLISKRTEAGLFYTDEDYPTDPMDRVCEKMGVVSVYHLLPHVVCCVFQHFEGGCSLRTPVFRNPVYFHIPWEETWYYMPQGRMLRQDDEVAEQVKVSAQKRLNNELFGAMTGENGVLPAGALPSVKTATEAGQRALQEALDDDGKAVTARPKKRPKKPETNDAEEVTPKTTLELAKDELTSVLDESTKARSKSIQLKDVEFADQLSSEMLKHANKMEVYYGELKVATKEDSPDESVITKLLKKIEKARAWYKNAEASATGILKVKKPTNEKRASRKAKD